MSRTVLPSLDDDDANSSSGLSIGKALDQAYKWLDYSGRFALYVEERSRYGKCRSVSVSHLFCALWINKFIFIICML